MQNAICTQAKTGNSAMYGAAHSTYIPAFFLVSLNLRGAYETIHPFLSTLLPSYAAWTRSLSILPRLRTTPSPGDIQISTPSPPSDAAVGGWSLPAGRGSADHWS